MTDDVVRLSTALSDRYRIEREIGAGGMATVYVAEDVRHRRRVALKVLRPELGAVLGTDRFLSEINVTARLQHPHLLPLFDSGEADGLLFYVMPYVEGESLRARLERERQLPIDEAVRLAAGVASALDYAHRHGIIHRDLKPENILLHDGQPLVADFGIALAVSNAGGGRVTQTGLSLGTPQYMSPEQATGDRVIDARSDIYSLGAVLYEMLTGEAPHTGATSQAIIVRLLTEKPRSVSAVRPSVPGHVAAAVEHALEKLPADRFASVREFLDVLEGRRVLAAPTAVLAAASPAVARSWRDAARHPLTIAALAVAVLGWVGMLALRTRATAGAADTAVRFEYSPAPNEGDFAVYATPFAMSPDGRAFIYRAALQGQSARLYYRELRNDAARQVADAVSLGSMAISPDGRTVAFLQGGESIFRMALEGTGSPLMVARGTTLAGIAWAGDELIVGSNTAPLRAVSAAGGTLRDLLPLDTAHAEQSQRWPVVLPDGETLLYMSWNGSSGTAQVGIASLRTGKSAVLDVLGTPLGRIADLLVYHDRRSMRIFGVPFDFRRWRTRGPVSILADSVSINVALSPAGTLMFLRGTAAPGAELVELDMNGETRTVLPFHRAFTTPRYSPDARRIAVGVATDTATDLWIHDTRAGTFSPAIRNIGSAGAAWSPDGRELLFVSRMRGLWRQSADGTAPAERVQAPSERGLPVQGIFTPDGRHLVYRTGFNGDDVWYRALEGDTTSRPLAADPAFIERNTSISPDGRWAAYASDESGAYQVYVRPFPGPGPRHAITIDGGDTPVWSPDGRSIYYVNGPQFEVATLALPDVEVTRRTLFEHGAHMEDWWRNWDLSPDGRHFLVVRNAAAEERSQRLVVIHNWAADVRALRGATK